ncbi:MAG: ATP-binding protein, partial [Muribaculaceae bacterium]|nr:ATP-binding protein [Muribaculaceae bacterium]
MTKDELVAKLHDIEWEDFEVKAAKSELPKNIWESVSAFSNTSGGWIVLGVKQSGKTFEIQGVDNIEKLEQDFLGTLRSEKFNERLSVISKRYDIDGKKLLAFYVPEVDMKPIYFGNPINTFIRMGSGDQRATEGEIRAMFRNQSFGKKTEE